MEPESSDDILDSDGLKPLQISTHYRIYNTVLKTFRPHIILPLHFSHRQSRLDRYCHLLYLNGKLERNLKVIREKQRENEYEDEEVTAPLAKRATELATFHHIAFRQMLDISTQAIMEGWSDFLPSQDETVLSDRSFPEGNQPAGTQTNPINLD